VPFFNTQIKSYFSLLRLIASTVFPAFFQICISRKPGLSWEKQLLNDELEEDGATQSIPDFLLSESRGHSREQLVRMMNAK
jgi:hypothetical protein